MTPRIDRERRTIAVMIGIYCSARHDDGPDASALCPECSGLLDYAMARVDKCPFIDDKPTCARCPVHCYRAAERARIREVMRYAGPRMVYRHPLLTLRHYADQVRHRPKPRRRSDEAHRPQP